MMAAAVLSSTSKRKRGRPPTITKTGTTLSCGVCCKNFKHMSSLSEHLRTHSGENRLRCTVPGCNKSFARKQNLATHLIVHQGTKPFSCRFCQAGFSSNAAAQEHEWLHSDSRPHACSVCHRTFRQVSCLHRHMATHSQSKPFACQTCGKCFSLSMYLRSHLKVHTGEKPFNCPVCHRAFAHLSDVKRHQTTHTGEKPYSCEVCSASFSDASSKRRHIRESTRCARNARVRSATMATRRKDGHCRVIDVVETDAYNDEQAHGCLLLDRCNALVNVFSSQTMAPKVLHDHGHGTQSNSEVETVVNIVSSSGENDIRISPNNSTYSIEEVSLTEQDREESKYEKNLNSFGASGEDCNETGIPEVSCSSSGLLEVVRVHEDAGDDVNVPSMLQSVTQLTSNTTLCGTFQKRGDNLVVSGSTEPVNINGSCDNRVETLHLETNVTSIYTMPDLNTNHISHTTPYPNKDPKDDSSCINQATVIEELLPSDEPTRRSNYVQNPNFESQDYFIWLADFTESCKNEVVPLASDAFRRINTVREQLTALMVHADGVLSTKDNYRIMLSITCDLSDILTAHMRCILDELQELPS